MSNKEKDKDNNTIPDYLDVSSEEEPYKNVKEKESILRNNNKFINDDYSSHSYKSREKYYEDKYYHKYRKYKSRSRHRYNNKSRSRSHSRSYHHRDKKHHFNRRDENNSDHSRNKNNNSSSSLNSYKRDRNKHYHKHKNYRNHSNSSYSSYSKDKYKYNSRDRNKKYKNDDIEEKSRKNIYDEEKYSHNTKDKKEEIIKINKWTEGEKKEEFKQIKVEKYDKNKNIKNYNNKEKEKEISKLKKNLTEQKEEIIEKEKPNFSPSGILLKDLEVEYNKSMNNKVSINYRPPNDSIMPSQNEIWFLFKFAEDKKEAEETYKLIEKEFYLIGKDPRVCDIRIKQKNISRQHAVIQFRKIRKEKEWEIVPYLIDLNSTNGTYLNGDKIDNKKYYELRDKDELNFGDKKIDFLLMKTK